MWSMGLQQRTLTRGGGCQSELIQEQMFAKWTCIWSAVPITDYREVGILVTAAQLSIAHPPLYRSPQTATHSIDCSFDARAATTNDVQ